MAEEKTLTAWVVSAGKGDQYAIRSLYNEFGKDMFNISIRMTGNREDAEEVLQDSFVKAFKSLGQLKVPELFGGWLRQIVINNCLQLSRKKKMFDALTEFHEVAIEQEDDWFIEERLSTIHEAIKSLPDGCRQIFLLYTLEDYTHKEIGRLLKVSESTSKSQYLRAKKILQNQLKVVNG